MTRGLLILLAFAVWGCSDSKPTAPTGTKSAAAGGSGGSTGAFGANGGGGSAGTGTPQSGGAGGDSTVCHASSLSTAPVPCLQDWTHAKAKYPSQCGQDGGYQARCAPYDTIVYDVNSSHVFCYYDPDTGNLIAARSTTDTAAGACVTFDLGFSEPDTSACTPVSGNQCPPGAP